MIIYLYLYCGSCSIYDCGEAESVPAIQFYSVLLRSCKYKIAGKLWNARHSVINFIFISQRPNLKCEFILLLLAFGVQVPVCITQRQCETGFGRDSLCKLVSIVIWCGRERRRIQGFEPIQRVGVYLDREEEDNKRNMQQSGIRSQHWLVQ